MNCRYPPLAHALWIVAAVAGFGLSNPSSAGSFKVSPVRVDLTPAAPTAAIVVQNESDTDSVVVQLHPKRWSQDNGQDVYTPSPEFIATPPIFTLKPRASQVIRVGLRKAEPGNSQITYRLYITEIPGAPKPGFRGMQVALNVGIPIFIAPKTQVGGPPEWRAEVLSGKKLALFAFNPANSHVQFLGAEIFEAGNDKPVAVIGKPRYALAGQTLRWELPLSRAPKGALRIAVRTGTGDLQADVATGNSAAKP